MKLCFYQTDIEKIHRNCLQSLAASGYTVELNDTGKGFIHARKEEEFPLHYSMIDLRVFRDKYAVIVSVISSNMSRLFGNFYHNRIDEEAFVEHLFGGLRKENLELFESFSKEGLFA